MTTKKFTLGLLFSTALIGGSPLSWSMEEQLEDQQEDSSVPRILQVGRDLTESVGGTFQDALTRIIVEEAKDAPNIVPLPPFLESRYDIVFDMVVEGLKAKRNDICASLETVIRDDTDLADRIATQEANWVGLRVRLFDLALRNRDIQFLKFLVKNGGEEIVTSWIKGESFPQNLDRGDGAAIEGQLLRFAKGKVTDLDDTFSILRAPLSSKNQLISTRADAITGGLKVNDEPFVLGIFGLPGTTPDELATAVSRGVQGRFAEVSKSAKKEDVAAIRTGFRKPFDLLTAAIAPFRKKNGNFPTLAEAYGAVDAYLIAQEREQE
ncbi:MAG: hypothetical protein LBF76_01405 [Holosporales bacterium]|nr:hypothetical protein [Holosporales bacterium]